MNGLIDVVLNDKPELWVRRIRHMDFLGCFLDWRAGSGPTVEILDVQVANGLRRQGIGKIMVERLFLNAQKFQTVWAITRADNLIAQRWYEALGFEVTGVLRRFYDRESKTVDAILYGRSPKGPV